MILAMLINFKFYLRKLFSFHSFLVQILPPIVFQTLNNPLLRNDIDFRISILILYFCLGISVFVFEKSTIDSWPSVDALLSGGDHRQEEDGGNLGT